MILMKSSFLTWLAVTSMHVVHADSTSYEVWGYDQSNSVEGLDSLGVRGSLLWIWDAQDVPEVLSSGTTPDSKPCSPEATTGPCDLFTIFPEDLMNSVNMEKLGNASNFGRYHGITKDPQDKYVTANIFAPNGGYLGIIDTESKGAVGLFRVTEMSYDGGNSGTQTTRNVHMSFWNFDGTAIIIHNLGGKAVERINVDRDQEGKITALTFDKSATVGMGKGMTINTEASFYTGNNAFGIPLLGSVTGSYDEADLGDLTPTGHCKENGCAEAASEEKRMVGRPNNVPICPVMAPNGLVFNTFGGGGLLVLDSTKTPMAFVGAYGNAVIYGAGVCGETVSDHVYFTAGASASGAGADQSMWALFGFAYTGFASTYEENSPGPAMMYDFNGTATGGRALGTGTDTTGQVPGITTRRDAHDLAGTIDGRYLHVVDRIQNVVDVFDSTTQAFVGTYDLTTASGAMDDTQVGPCAAASVTDGGDGFPINDPAPDFIAPTPDGKYMVLSFRGPAPVSAIHAAQGSCPGLGIVELKEDGSSGVLVGVLRTVNTIADNVATIAPPGGVAYMGSERSDVHDVVVISRGKMEDEASSASSRCPHCAAMFLIALLISRRFF